MAKGRKKTSRKGKKAWRTNISTKELDDYVERTDREERSGGALDSIPDEALFFVDKSSDAALVKRTSKHREKVLRSDAILERQSLVPTLLAPKKKVKKAKAIRTKVLSYASGQVKEINARQAFDIWSDDSNNKSNASKKKAMSKKVASAARSAAAVDVDVPGCSFNPRFEDHQEALGLAVAQEMQKLYKKQLEPPPIPLMVPGVPVDEEDVYFLDVDDDAEDLSSGEEHVEGSKPIKVKKLTRADLNRRKRRKEQIRAEKESAKRAKLQKDLLRLNEIKKDVEKEQEDKQKDLMRRTVSKREKQEKGPPRLGKLRYQPGPLQVLLSEEVTGSMRKLKGCYDLAKDRYNNLQRCGLIEPRQPAKRRALQALLERKYCNEDVERRTGLRCRNTHQKAH
ncbi:hypothetical protein GOP47_0011577 [Adiantum capillus-veneris]|uniref:Ribosome biogenesis protein NOP53 n=1 Tax=Adiantum capillus-veneris TaxID=13818 RepID=A0A9D4UT20_ADICA|nr:hypothetical protein GOP47_0011577 [Adiantum capillus-veneris]